MRYERGFISQKTTFFIVTALKTSHRTCYSLGNISVVRAILSRRIFSINFVQYVPSLSLITRLKRRSQELNNLNLAETLNESRKFVDKNLILNRLLLT
jgi:hypothetical protein